MPSVLRLASCTVLLTAVLLTAVLLGATACGGGSSTGDDPSGGLPPGSVEGGTVAVLNQTDQGQAPLVIEQFFLSRVGDPDPGPNRLAADLMPGGVVLLGVFAPGHYDAVAVLATGPSIVFLDREIVAGQPTNFVIPGS